MGEKKFKDVETLLRTKDASRLVIEQDLNRKTGDVFLEQTERVPVTDEKGCAIIYYDPSKLPLFNVDQVRIL